MARKRRRPPDPAALEAELRALLEAPPLRDPDAEPERAIREFIAAVARGKCPSPLLLHWVADRLRVISDDPAHSARPAFGLRKRGRGRPAAEQRRNPDAEPERAIREFIAATARGEYPSPQLLLWIAERLEAINKDPAHPARPAFGLPKRARGRGVNNDENAKRLVWIALARAYGYGKERAAKLAAHQFSKSADTMLELAKAGTRKPAPDLSADELRELEDTLLSWGVPLPERPPSGSGENSPN